MIVAFQDDGGVFTFKTPEQACREYEGTDVESEAVYFFNDAGIAMRPVFDTPNTFGSLFGVITWSQSGSYHLEPDPGYQTESLDELLSLVQYVDAGSRFDSIEDVKKLFTDQKQ